MAEGNIGQLKRDGFVGAYRVEMAGASDRSQLFLDLPNKVWTYAKNNYAADALPTVTDDVNSGYRQGVSKWFYNGEIYLLKDETAGAAAWERTNLELEDLQSVAVSGSTSDLTEGTNLFYTDERVDDRVASLIQDGIGIQWDYSDGGATLTPTITLVPFDTGDLSEGTNLYYTDARVKNVLGALDSDIVFDDSSLRSIAGITASNLLDKSANETITGIWTLGASLSNSLGSLQVQGNAATQGLKVTTSPYSSTKLHIFSGTATQINFNYESGSGNGISHYIKTDTGYLEVASGLSFTSATIPIAGIQNQNLLDKTADETISGNYTITGNWTFQGSTFAVDSQISTADSVIVLNDGEAGAGVTLGYSGFYLDRGTANPYWFGFDEVRNLFTIGEITALSTAQIATTQAVATREDSPTNNGVAYWSDASNKFLTTLTPFMSEVILGGGTNTNPSISFQNSNGLYLPTSDTISLVTDGTVRMTWNNSQISVARNLISGTAGAYDLGSVSNYFGSIHYNGTLFGGGADFTADIDMNNNDILNLANITRTGLLTLSATTGIDLAYNGTTELSVESGLVEVQNDLSVLGNSTFNGVITNSRNGETKYVLSRPGTHSYTLGLTSDSRFRIINSTEARNDYTINSNGDHVYGGNQQCLSTYSNVVTTGVKTMIIDSVGRYGVASSLRQHKTNIQPIKDVSWLYDLNPVTFHYKVKVGDRFINKPQNELNYGLIAEDVEKVNHWIAYYDNKKLSGVGYERLITPILFAIQNHKKELNSINEKLTTIEKHLNIKS